MNQYGITHEAKSAYAYAYNQDTIHLRLKTAKDDVQSVSVVWGDPFHWSKQDGSKRSHWVQGQASPTPMEKLYSDALYDHWSIAVSPKFKRMRYGFIVSSDSQRYLYGAHGLLDLSKHPEAESALGEFFNFPYINEEDVFTAPSWVKDTVWYQIFPERFANGDASLNHPETRPWGSEKTVTNEMYFGGDLQGIIDKFDYMADLGITGIYFTPIFEAAATHKYDTIDYYKIDPAFGTNEVFKQLVEKAHEKGIRVMLDAVFNHCGFKHPYFQDVCEKGASSEYARCFHILDYPVVNFPLNEQGFPDTRNMDTAGTLHYETFAFTPNMPKWRTGDAVAEAYLLDVATYWIKNYDIDGWRLDVSNEVSHAFWRKFKKHVEAVKPDIFILGENWDNSNPCLKGDQFHSVMNYEFTYPVWHLLSHDPLYSDFGVQAFKDQISRLLMAYPEQVTANMFNLLDSHDTSRILTILGDDIRRVKIAFALQMTFAGCPSVYYGSEVGLVGENDCNRQCMPWDEARQNTALKAFVKRLIELRRLHPEMKAVHLSWLDLPADRHVFGYEKRDGDHRIVCLYNVSDEPYDFDMTNHFSKELVENRTIEKDETITLAPFSFGLFK